MKLLLRKDVDRKTGDFIMPVSTELGRRDGQPSTESNGWALSPSLKTAAFLFVTASDSVEIPQ